MSTLPYDSVLVLSFGGPEKKADVIPFLENVLRGKNVPRERMLEVAEHYYHFNGFSPINEQNRALISALRAELKAHGPDLPVFWGNRNWHPFLADTLREMRDKGHTRTLAYVTSAFSSYSGCRQYREDVLRAQAEVGPVPSVEKLRVFYNHPLFIETVAANVRVAMADLENQGRPAERLLFTAHSVPMSMATTSNYVQQLEEACCLVAEALGNPRWELVYQSRSGPPSQPWLEPDVNHRLRELRGEGLKSVVLSPIGFVSDHMEVLYDLDTEAKDTCAELGIAMARASAPNHAPSFIGLVRELIAERCGLVPARAIGRFGPNHDVCPVDCCPAPVRPAVRQLS